MAGCQGHQPCGRGERAGGRRAQPSAGRPGGVGTVPPVAGARGAPRITGRLPAHAARVAGEMFRLAGRPGRGQDSPQQHPRAAVAVSGIS